MSLLRLGIAASIGAAAIAIALTAAAQAAAPTRSWTQTPANEAGSSSTRTATTSRSGTTTRMAAGFRCAGTTSASATAGRRSTPPGGHGLYRVNMAERPHQDLGEVAGRRADCSAKSLATSAPRLETPTFSNTAFR